VCVLRSGFLVHRRGVLESGTSVIYLGGQDGIDRAWLEVSGNAPTLVFRDQTGNQRVVLGGFALHLALGATQIRPTSSLVLIGEDGRIFFTAP